MAKYIFKVFGLLAFLITGSIQAESLILKNEKSYSLGKYLSFLEDKKGSLTFEDILKGNHDQKYFKLNQDAPNLGFTHSFYWVKFSITKESDSHGLYYLLYEFPGLDRIEFYQNINGTWEKEISGDLIPFTKKKISHRFFPFKIYPKKNSVYYMRLKNTAAMRVPLKVYTPEEFNKDKVEGVLGFSYFVGLLSIMFAYHLVIYISTRMLEYIYYSIYLAGMTILTLSITGFGGQYILPQLTWFNNEGIVISVTLCVVGLSFFLYHFLEIKDLDKKYKYSYYFVNILGLFYILSAIVTPFKFSVRFIIFTVGIPLSILLFWSISSFVRKQKSSKFVIYGFCALFLGAIMRTIHGIGILPDHFIFEKGFYFGVIIQLLLFSLGLAELINVLKKEAFEKAEIISGLNKDLEAKVLKRTEQLKESLDNIKILMDNMAQSVFAIDHKGVIIEPVSKYSYNIFGETIVGKSIWKTLFKDLNPKEKEFSSLEFGFTTCFFSDDLQWDMMKDNFPNKFKFSSDDDHKSLKTKMRPIFYEGILEKIMFIVEDVTEIEKLEADIRRQRSENALKIEKLQSIVSNSKDSLITFLKEAYDLIRVIDKESNKNAFLRAVHTLKGLSRLYGLNFLATKLHTIESDLIQIFEDGIHKKRFEEDKKNKVDLLKDSLDSTLESIKEIYGELYDPHKELKHLEGDTIEVHRELLNVTYNEISQLIQTENYSPILNMIKKLSNIDIKNMASNLKNIVTNTAKKLEKEVLFQVSGDNTYLPQENIAILKESFIHLFTNCVDHGIEKKGEITVDIKEKFDGIYIKVADNGRGINENAVLQKALDTKLLTEEEAENMDSIDIKKLIFKPSFSTKEITTETSGRGIGMDVVKKNIEKLKGIIDIEEGILEGTSFLISLPHFEKKA
ncbi:MAG: 7TM diverse intracellular signaling domain-containing protein [Bdellovibrionota bacterium]|nr:7TM diverse intracellular signaling domain-containing protein [Bdellovibrionota bacterium]